ncbi:hypothetical protein Gotur_003585, partial [Gossypium turneri]
MPDLIDTGDPDDYNGLDSSTKDQNDQNTAVRTATPLIDDLLGDGIGTNLSTSELDAVINASQWRIPRHFVSWDRQPLTQVLSELKNDDDPFADVSFHTTKGRKNVDDLFSGMSVDDKSAM